MEVVPSASGYGAVAGENEDELPKLAQVEKDSVEDADSKWMGGKNIDFFGSVVLTINNVSGPGMLALPVVFQEAGWLFPITMLLFMCFTSSLCGTLICDTVARVPGNSQFEKRIEFETVFSVFMGDSWGVLAQVLFVVCLMSQCLASIIETAQVMDGFVVYIFSSTYGVEFYPQFQFKQWKLSECQQATNPYCIPFQDDATFSVILTAGYVLLTAIVLPMGCMNLDDNITIQIISFWMLVALTGVFIVNYITIGLDFDAVPMIGSNFSEALGTVIFNYAFIVFLPSWVNEKKPDVSVNKTIWYSTISSTMMYIAMGLLGGWAYPHANENILDVLVSPTELHAGTESPAWHEFIRVCAMLFAIGIIGLGIPVFCIMMRYNLMTAKVCSPWMATFWGNIFPWTIAWTMSQGDTAQKLMDLTGLTTNGFINFIAPLYLAYKAMDWVTPQVEDGSVQAATEKGASSRAQTTVEPLPPYVVMHEKTIVVALLLVLTPITLWGALSQM
jgi:hypothetical protein